MELLIKTQISFFLIQLWDKVVEACMLTNLICLTIFVKGRSVFMSAV